MRTEQACDKIDTGRYPIKTKKVNGITFHWGITGGAAMSNSKMGSTFRIFHQNVCFEIALATAAFSLGVVDPVAVRAFDAAKLDRALNEMVHTFKFEGHVKDGPGWKVYYDSGCGGIYEYPEGETVQTNTEYSGDGFYSSDVTCSRHFTHQGRDYRVEAKANLKDKNDFGKWLKSSGYPDLTKAQAIVASKYCSEYRAAPYYYIFGQATAYIFSVADAKGEVLNPHDDPVFMHLLNSFKVR